MKRIITAALAAAVLGVAAPGCGSDGGRENVDQSNQGELDPQGGEGMPQEPATGITPTGEEQPSVTQPEGGGY